MQTKFICFILCVLFLPFVNGQDCKGIEIGQRSCDSVLAATNIAGLIDYLDEVNQRSKAICPVDYEQRFVNLSWGAYSLLSKGYYESTIQLYKRIQKEAKIERDTIYELYMQAYIGNANLFKGDFQTVIDVMNEGYGRLLEYNIEDEYLLGLYPHSIGQAYRYLGENEQAITYLDMALPALEASDSEMLSDNYLAKADIAIENKEYIVAKKQLSKITGTNIDNYKDTHWGHGSYRSLSKIAAAEGDYDKSIDLLEYAESSLGDPRQWSMLPSIAMYEKADIHLQFKNEAKARIEIIRALNQLGITDWQHADYSAHPNLQYVLSSLSIYAEVIEMELTHDDNSIAREELDMLYQRIFGVIELLFQDFSSRRGASLWRDYNYLYTNAIDNVFHLYKKYKTDTYLNRGLAYSVRSKSQELYNNSKSRSHASLSVDVSEEIEASQSSLNAVKLKMLEAKVANDAIAIATASAEYAKIQEKIRKIELPFQTKHPKRALNFQIEIDEVELNNGQAKLEIYESADRWNVWTITSKSIKWSRQEKDTSWDAMAAHYSKHIGNQYDFTKLETSLSFLTEIFCDLSSQGIQLITVVSDKTLSTIPLDLLYTCNTGFSDSQVSINFSYNLLSSSNSDIPLQDIDYEYSVLAWAPSYGSLNPDDVEDELVAELVRSGNYNLPGAQLEALTVSAILDGVSIMGEQATKTSFFENIGKSRVLHLSMHALMNREEGGLSKFLFSNQEEDLNSSYLHAFELEKLSLSAELAVLSACETGLGPIDEGEGVMSLARSFAMAGVPSTVMTLWQVPDQSSSTIMTLFYRYLKEGQGKVDALSNAKKEYVKTCVDEDLKHPYYWAGFVLIGNNSPVVDSKDNAPFKYPLYLVLAVGVGLLTKRWLQFV